MGELETKSTPARKFSQSFVLAVQPNGFYVLNDIFRFLKDQLSEERSKQDFPETAVSEVHDVQVDAEPEKPLENPPKDESVAYEEPVPVSVNEQPLGITEKAKEDICERSQATEEDTGVKSAKSSASSEPKTWAKLAEIDKERWAKHVSEAKGQTVAPVSNKSTRKSTSANTTGGEQVFVNKEQQQQKVKHDNVTGRVWTSSWLSKMG